MKKKKWIWIFGIVLLLFAATAAGPIMSNVETPKYKVLHQSGEFEIREYDPLIIAKVTMSGDRSETVGDGFRVLADYIFGSNEGENKISMTAPVEQMESQDSWQISFVMPSSFTLDSLPTPKNGAVGLENIKAKHYAVIRFSGSNDDQNLEKHEKQLMAYMQTNDLHGSSNPKYAFYNPPWTFPVLRRNEIMVEITPPQDLARVN